MKAIYFHFCALGALRYMTQFVCRALNSFRKKFTRRPPLGWPFVVRMVSTFPGRCFLSPRFIHHFCGSSNHPFQPQTITLRRVPAEDAARQLLRGHSVSGDEDTTVVGIAYHISETGAADFICLVNLTSAFIISTKSQSHSGNNFPCRYRCRRRRKLSHFPPK